MADAKAGFKAEMDAPSWQRGVEGGGRVGDRTEGHLAGSSGCRRQHTWSLQAARDQSVACPPPQGRCPHTELHGISQPAAFPGLDERPAHISPWLPVSCRNALFTGASTAVAWLQPLPSHQRKRTENFTVPAGCRAMSKDVLAGKKAVPGLPAAE